MKPVIGIIDGEIVLLGGIIRKKKILEYLIKFLENGNLDKNSKIYIMNSNCNELLELFKNYLDNKKYKYYIINIGCVVGAYSGGKSIGVSIKCV